MKTLKDLIELSANVRIYVPSTINVDTEFDPTREVDGTSTFLSDLFGGSTAFKALGNWVSPEVGLVKENVTIIESYTDTTTLEQHISVVIEYCEEMCKRLGQEAISLEVNNKLYFVS